MKARAIATILLVEILTLSKAAAVPVSYLYTGAPFDTFGDEVPTGLTRITAEFTFSAPLAPNLIEAGEPASWGADLLGWSMSDGNVVVALLDGVFSTNLTLAGNEPHLREPNLSTDVSGAIVSWDFSFSSALMFPPAGVGRHISMGSTGGDFVQIIDSTSYCADFDCTLFNSAFAEASPGNWRRTSVPQPATGWLVALGLCAVLIRCGCSSRCPTRTFDP